jgi:hypothetical protein
VQSERRTSDLLADNGTLAGDLQAAQSTIARLEREAGVLRLRDTGGGVGDSPGKRSLMAGGGAASDVTAAGEAAAEKTLRTVVSELQKSLRECEEGRRADRLSAQAAAREAGAGLVRTREALAKAEAALAARPLVEDYQGVRRQLRVLQRVAFNAGGDDDGDDDERDDGPESTLGQVEVMLAGRVKVLETELVDTRGNLADSKVQCIVVNRPK